jgi:hypothetical protein
VAVTPATNGLVSAAIVAWNNHHHLVLRPDDIWLAILCQIGVFIAANSEELRDIFVSHKGTKDLVVKQYGVTPWIADYGRFAADVTKEIAKNIKDPELAPWAMPNFSTTTPDDRIATAVLLVGQGLLQLRLRLLHLRYPLRHPPRRARRLGQARQQDQRHPRHLPRRVSHRQDLRRHPQTRPRRPGRLPRRAPAPRAAHGPHL